MKSSAPSSRALARIELSELWPVIMITTIDDVRLPSLSFRRSASPSKDSWRLRSRSATSIVA